MAIGELRSRILACRWMTWDFLKLCMKTFVVRTLLREFRDQNLPWQEVLPVERRPYPAAKLPWHGGASVKESVVRDFVRDVFALKGHLGIRYRKDLCDCDYTDKRMKVLADLYKWFQARDNPGANGEEEESEMPESDNHGHDEDSNRGYQCLGVQGWERDENDTSISVNDVTVTSALRTYSWGPVDGTSRISIGISPRNGLVILETRLRRETNPEKMEMTSRRCKCLCRQYYTYIPVKLLHGPWTEDQLSFLEALLESGASLDADNKSHREIAKKGLTDAIWRDNYRAVDLLISEPMESQHNERYEPNYFEPSWCEAEFAMDIRTDSRE